MLEIVKRIAAVPLRFALLFLVFLGLTRLDSRVTTFSHLLMYVVLGALFLIAFCFRKQKAALLLGLLLLIAVPLDYFGPAYFDQMVISNGIVVLLAINTLLFGLFQEGHMRLGALVTLVLLIVLQTLAVFTAAHYVRSGALILQSPGTLPLPLVQLGNLSPEVTLILLVCLVGSILRELFAPHSFARLTVNMVMGTGIFFYLPIGLSFPPYSLLLVLGVLIGLYVFREIYQVSYIDPLTGIPTRRALLEEASKLTGSYIVAMADVDHFKKFNDKYGHDVGDDVLNFVASLLRQNVKGSVFRYGGEEFTILFRKGSLKEVMKHLDEVRELVASSEFKVRRKTAKNPNSGQNVKITISIGVAERSEKHRSFNEVLKAADKALYRAKTKGRNQVSK